jgi:hypothetical protein
MKTKLAVLLSILMLAAAAFGEGPNPTCNLRSAVGAYGYSCSGVAPNPFNNFAIEPFSAYGYVTGDSKGQWNGYGKVSFNGRIASWTHNTRQNAPAVVNPDCTGAVTYEVTVGGYPVPDAHFEYVIVNSGQEIKGFPVDQGYAVSCQLIREK